MPLLRGKRLEAGRFSCSIKNGFLLQAKQCCIAPLETLAKGIDFGTLPEAHRHSLAEIVRLVSLERADPSPADGT